MITDETPKKERSKSRERERERGETCGVVLQARPISLSEMGHRHTRKKRRKQMNWRKRENGENWKNEIRFPNLLPFVLHGQEIFVTVEKMSRLNNAERLPLLFSYQQALERGGEEEMGEKGEWYDRVSMVGERERAKPEVGQALAKHLQLFGAWDILKTYANTLARTR